MPYLNVYELHQLSNWIPICILCEPWWFVVRPFLAAIWKKNSNQLSAISNPIRSKIEIYVKYVTFPRLFRYISASRKSALTRRIAYTTNWSEFVLLWCCEWRRNEHFLLDIVSFLGSKNALAIQQHTFRTASDVCQPCYHQIVEWIPNSFFVSSGGGRPHSHLKLSVFSVYYLCFSIFPLSQ